MTPAHAGATPTLALLALALGCQSPEPAGRLYLGSGITDQVFVLDPDDGRILDTLPLDARRGEVDEPHGLAVSPDGSHWYATLSHGEPTLWKFEADGDRLVGRVQLGIPGAARVGITPDGSRAFVPDYWRTGGGAPSRVAVVDLHDLVVVDTPVLCPAPHDAVVTPVGDLVAVTCSLSDEIILLDPSSLELVSRFPTRPDPGPPGEPRDKPMNLAWSADGSRLFVTLMTAGAVGVYARDGTLLGRVPVGGAPTQIARDGQDGLVVVNRAGSLSLVDTVELAERRRIELSGIPFPHGIAVAADGSTAFVSFEGTVESLGGAAAVDLESGGILWKTEAGAYTLGIALLEGA